jgi:hypothetical protein
MFVCARHGCLEIGINRCFSPTFLPMHSDFLIFLAWVEIRTSVAYYSLHTHFFSYFQALKRIFISSKITLLNEVLVVNHALKSDQRSLDRSRTVLSLSACKHVSASQDYCHFNASSDYYDLSIAK